MYNFLSRHINPFLPCVSFQVVTVTLALICVAKYIFENDYVRTRSRTVSDGTLVTNGDVGHLQKDTVSNGNAHRGTMNGEVPVTGGGDGITIARKALYHIGEGVSALVKSVTNDNVCLLLIFRGLNIIWSRWAQKGGRICNHNLYRTALLWKEL